jgi:hypothetical protein
MLSMPRNYSGLGTDAVSMDTNAGLEYFPGEQKVRFGRASQNQNDMREN